METFENMHKECSNNPKVEESDKIQEEKKKNTTNKKPKTYNKKIDLISSTSIIILNNNGLKKPIKIKDYHN